VIRSLSPATPTRTACLSRPSTQAVAIALFLALVGLAMAIYLDVRGAHAD
jgi:hypothetical protein